MKRCVFTAIGCCLGLSTASAIAIEYQLLVTPFGQSPSYLSEQGSIVGRIAGFNKLWSPTGGLESIAPPPGIDYHSFTGFNRNGDMHGVVESAGRYRMLTRSVNGDYLVYPYLGVDSFSMELNDNGDLLFQTMFFSSTSYGFWAAGSSSATYLGPTWDMNNAGEFVGIPGRRTLSTGWVPLQAGSQASYQHHINEGGFVTAFNSSALTVSDSRLFFWGPQNQLLNEVSLGNSNPVSGESSSVYGINDANIVYGASMLAGGRRAFAWSQQDGVVQLESRVSNLQGYQLIESTGMNSRGEILVTAKKNGQSYHVLLQPVPEPASFVAFGLGAVALLRRRARK